MKAHFLNTVVSLSALLLAISIKTVAQAENTADTGSHRKRIYTTQFTLNAPVVDGRLTDSCWQQGEWQSDYEELSPVYHAKPSQQTFIKVLYNDKNVFVGIRAFDDMKKITKRLGRRDGYLGDLVGVIFDSYFDHRTAFEFDITAAGQKIDCWVSNDGWDINWNAVWNAKVFYEDSAWTAEFEIPLSQLRYGALSMQTWGFNAWRRVDRLQEESHWNLVANDGTGLVYTFGELHGLNNLKRNKRLEIAPYVSGRLTTDKAIPGNPFARASSTFGQAGLDAKIGITNNFTLNATINPDFGQVEADPSVMNLTAFETYFEEKRPFFTEGKSLLEFSFDADQLFYSRRIGHAPSYRPAYDTLNMPDFTTIGGAFKFSGKTAKGLSVGIIESVTPNEMADIYHNNTHSKQKAEPFSNYFIGRFQKDYNKGNTIIGGILTHTHRSISDGYLNFLSRNALTYGLDFTHYWNDRKYFIELKTIGSNINGDKEAITRLQSSSARYLQRPGISGIVFDTNKTALSGLGASFKIGKWSKGHWRYSNEFIMRSPGLELNDLGYMNIANLIKNNINLSYAERTNTNTFKNYTFTLLQQNAWDTHGDGLYSLFSLTAQAEFMNSWVAQVSTQYKFRTLDEWLLRGGVAMKVPAQFKYGLMLQSNASKKMFFTLVTDYYKAVSNSLRYLNLSAEVSYRPASNLLLSFAPLYQENVDQLQYIGQFDKGNAAKKYLLGKIDNRNIGFAFRVDYAFTPEFTLQYYGSPFVSIAKYSSYKEVTRPLDPVYENRFINLTQKKEGSNWSFDDNNDGIPDFNILNPDFNYKQFRSNLVLRWEYKVGSTFFLVWSQDRTEFTPTGAFDFEKGFNRLFDLHPRNVFMIKFSYLFRS